MRRLVATATVLVATLALAGCGEEEQDPPAAPAGGGAAQVIEITFEEGAVTPSGERVEVPRGGDVELVIEADEPGELHVHASTEQELSYATGTTTLRLSLGDEPPGVVDIESHELEQTVVQLQIS